MNRPDLLAENALPKAIADLRGELDDFRKRQPISGRSGVIGYFIESDDTWDIIGTVGTDGDVGSHQTDFTVTFTGDGTQVPTLANISFDVYVNGTDLAHKLTPENNTWTDGTRFASLNYNAIVETQTTYTQTFYLLTQKAITYYIKAYAVGGSGGTLTVTQP